MSSSEGKNNLVHSYRDEEKKRIRDTIEANRTGERKGIVIPPKPKVLPIDENYKKLRVAAYCRVSTLEDEQVGSFEMQIQHFKAVIDNNPEYELVNIYTDEGISGTSINKRAGFQQMIEDAKSGGIDLILTKSISRFGRNIVDIVSTLRELNSLSPPVVVKFESEGITTGDGNSNLLISILSALAELESQQKSIAVTEGIRYRMQEGLYRFNVSKTLGYYRDASGVIRIIPAEAKIVQYIYDSYVGGYSTVQIAKMLSEAGVKTPMGCDVWTTNTVLNILKNEKYKGDVLYQKTFTKDYITHKTVKNNNLITQWYWTDCHTAIIDKETWDKAQEIRKNKEYVKKDLAYYIIYYNSPHNIDSNINCFVKIR